MCEINYKKFIKWHNECYLCEYIEPILMNTYRISFIKKIIPNFRTLTYSFLKNSRSLQSWHKPRIIKIYVQLLLFLWTTKEWKARNEPILVDYDLWSENIYVCVYIVLRGFQKKIRVEFYLYKIGLFLIIL